MLSSLPGEATAFLASAQLLPFGVATTDDHGRVTFANTAYAQMAGCTPDELLGQSAGDFPWDALAHAAPSSEPWRGQANCKRKTGEAYSGEHSITTLRDPAGGVSGFWIMGRDATGLERYAGAPYQAEANLSALIESTDDLIASFDLECRLLTFNKALADTITRTVGVKAVVGMRLEDWLPAQKVALWPPMFDRALSEGPFRAEYSLLDGRILELSFSPIRQDDRAVGVSVFGKDITHRNSTEGVLRQTNEALAKAERHYRRLFNSISDAVIVFKLEVDGLSSHVSDVNENACHLLGYTRQELTALRVVDIDVPDNHANAPVIVSHLFTKGHSIREQEIIAKDGRRLPVEINTHVFDLDGSPTMISCIRDMSERKEAEKQYRDLFEGAQEGIFRTSIERKFVAANPALGKMLGYDSPQDLIATITDTDDQLWLDPNDRSRLAALLDKHGSVRGVQCQVKRKDGTALWVSINAQIVCGADGRPLYYDGFAQDVTERKRMEDALRRSEEKFAKVFLCSPAVTMLFTPEAEGNQIADVNEAFEQSTGFRREEVVGRTTLELGLWVDPGDYDEFMNQFRVAGRLRNFEHRIRTKSGDIGAGLTSAELIELDDLPYAVSATIDITKQKEVEDAMRSLVTAIEQSADTIVITDLNGIIEYCNPAFSKVSGYTREEAIGQNPRVLKSGKHSPNFYIKLWATITKGSVWTGRLINKKKDGSFYEEDATISPIRDASGKLSGYVAVKRDVTDRLQLEDQLRQAQKLESIGRLAGGVAHDFNNLLTVINGYSGFLLKGLKHGDPLRVYADEISIAGDRAGSLTKQLLAFSRKQVIEPKVLDLNAIVRESTAMLRRLIGDDIVLETHLDDLLGRVMADSDQIHQVIMNLAVNARDAMPDGGRLVIETKNVELGTEDSTAIPLDTTPGMYVSMTVSDNGQGMDETTRQQIFEPFFTTKEVGKGTGLGLATVYGIIRQSSGWIDVQSEVGVGTSFKVYLPQVDAPLNLWDEGIAPSAGGSETILVVEDQSAVRAFTAAALRQCGYQVLEGSDGEEAMAVAERHSGDLHLLVTDVVMPGINGKELSTRLKERCPNLKVLFISGYTADIIAQRGVLDPGVAFLHKPFSPDELAAKVREVLDRAL